jgi:hypothetical protein
MPVVYATRELVAAALFNIVTVSVGAVVGLKTSDRRIKMPKDVAPSQTPALFQVQVKETYEREPGHLIAIPPKRTMHFDLWLYVTDATNTTSGVTVVPSTQLNTMIQAVEAAFVPDFPTGGATLGGLVAAARIEGVIDYLETRTKDGLSMAMIPITVLIP